MDWHQIFGLLGFLFFSHISLSFSSPLCPPDQRDALLHFKSSYTLDTEASYSCYLFYGVASYPKTNSWNEGVDCCMWKGVTCDGVTGNVIGLNLTCSWLRGTLHSNSSLFLLRHLENLNLFGNNFVGSSISPNLSVFTKMTHLNLSRSHFLGTVPREISHLSKLVSLDLSFNFIESSLVSNLMLESSTFTMLIQNLTLVRKLVLDEVEMPMVSPMSFANLSSSLTHLSVSACSLQGIFPDTIFRLPNLIALDLSDNAMSGILPKSNWTSPLVSLSLKETYFSGEIPNSIGNLTTLSVLDLSGCRFIGFIPLSLGNLNQLKSLSLGVNSFSGIIEFEIFAKLTNLKFLYISHELNLISERINYTFPNLEVLQLPSCNLTQIPYFLSLSKRLILLDLSSNRISGEIPMWFWGISDMLETLFLSFNLLEGGIQQMHWKRLIDFDLQSNLFHGPLPIPPLSTLNFVASNNSFIGEIPSSICQLSSLQLLDLSYNNLSGNMPPCFGNMANLSFLVLENNKLQGPLPRSLVKCSKLSSLRLSHNEFSDTFPHWLEAPDLESLDLQSNKFHGRINFSTFELSFPALDGLLISNNNFIGQWPIKVFSNTSLRVIDLSKNKFVGPIPLPSPSTYYYSIASNNMTGKVTSLLCNATKLQMINLSNNSLIGSLPQCLTNFSIDLLVLNLRMNHLEGAIPQLVSSRNSLTTLDLSQNRFEGTLSRSLVKCKYLEVMDLSNNRIEDTFPGWLGTLPELKVLILRSNKFKDLLNIPKRAHLFPKLHILDLSNNNFSGPLPANLIMNLEAMMNVENVQEKSLYMARPFQWASYENSVTVTMKGLEIELVKILTIFTTIDLSSNFFQGDIPSVIGNLQSLIGLNLSHNHLTGSIPSSLGNLTNLGWLDLSSNKLNGVIPRKLGDLTFLGYLNLSKNQLIGQIPQDRQLSTFSSDSFRGNPGLCGTPLPIACPWDAQPHPPSSSPSFNREVHESWFKQKVVWIGYASGVVIGISTTYIAFEIGRPKWLAQGVRMLEKRAIEWKEKSKQMANQLHGQ